MKKFVCKRLKMLSYLKAKGFLPQETVPDINNPKFNVWVYEKTPELEIVIQEYFDMKREEREERNE